MVANSTTKDFDEILINCNEKFDETSIMAILVVCAYIVTTLYYASLNKICASHIYYVHRDRVMYFSLDSWNVCWLLVIKYF